MCDCAATREEKRAGIHYDDCATRAEGPADDPADHYGQ